MMNHYAYRRQAGVHSVTPRGVSAVTEEACNPRNPGRSLKRQRRFPGAGDTSFSDTNWGQDGQILGPGRKAAHIKVVR